MRSEKEAVSFHGPYSYRQRSDGCLFIHGRSSPRPVGRTKRVDASVEYLLSCLALLGCTRERTLRRLLGWFGTPAIEESSDDRDIGRLPATRRSAKSLSVSYSQVVACGRLQHHSATAKQYCPSSSTVARQTQSVDRGRRGDARGGRRAAEDPLRSRFRRGLRHDRDHVAHPSQSAGDAETAVPRHRGA
jgi:hypothetical protein